MVGKAVILLKPWSVYRAGARIEVPLGIFEWLHSRGYCRVAGDDGDVPEEAPGMPQEAAAPPTAPAALQEPPTPPAAAATPQEPATHPGPPKPRRGRPPRTGLGGGNVR